MYTCCLGVMESLPLFVVLHVYVLLGKLYICCVFMLLYTCNIHLTFFSLSPAYCTHKYRKSASCTHVSAALHALSSLKPASFSLQPNLLPASSSEDDAMDTPCTSLPCQWKPPKKRKESTLRLYEASFVKHDYAKPSKRKVRCIEEYDPRPPAFRGSTAQRLPALLQQLKGQQLCVSILFDPECRQDTLEEVQNPGSHKLPSKAVLSETISAFKRSLKVTHDVAREIERSTREQQLSLQWFSFRKYRITASIFGAVLSRRPTTAPNSLVLRIIQPKNFNTAATVYGIENEGVAIKKYTEHQQTNGHPDLVVSASGFHVNPAFSFLGASPDGAVYDPSDNEKPFGFLEVKCPYSAKEVDPTAACAKSSFFCDLDAGGLPQLKKTHAYYAQVQGQMAIGERPWCDFVVYTNKGLTVERIYFNATYWNDKLLPKLVKFYDNCVVPEIVSPVHHIGLPVRDLSLE